MHSIEDRLRSATERATHSQRQVSFLGAAVPGVYQSLAVVIVLAGLAVVHTTDTGSVAELGAVVLLLIRSVSYGQQLQTGANSLNGVAPYLRAIRDLEGDYVANRRTAGDEPVTDIGRLQLNDISYRYDGAVDALTDVSLDIARG